MSKVVMYSDGGARGNPGPAGIGVVVVRDEEVINEISEYIGEGTNNQAEYEALIRGLNWLVENVSESDIIECKLDSELVVKQINGEYRVKNVDLIGKYNQVMSAIGGIKERISFVHIRREQNKKADYLVNKALDNFQEERK